MKTAISIPDAVFQQADRFAKRRAISRSELYTRAVRAYLEQEEHVTEQLNAVYDTEASKLDMVLEELQYRSVREDRLAER
ncbi:MAG: hypothetical protein OXF97_09470 [Nitrospira sp.]|nr:hypothetical protein [Nitrospira sp.]MCY3955235.1 hypothetical protein [Nitrospira sp.]MCY4132806.1 hypothetical protein [Nitrospira sp.]